MQENKTIPNWTMFGVRHTQVQIFEEKDGFRAGLFLFIDNEIEKEKANDYNVTLFTEIYHSDKNQCAKIAFLYSSTIFDNMDPLVKVFNYDGEPMPDIDLRTTSMVPAGQRLQ